MSQPPRRRERVKLGKQLFIVSFDDEGNPRSIKQRKTYAPGKPWSALHDAPYWHHSASLGGPKTKPRRIIEQAQKQRTDHAT